MLSKRECYECDKEDLTEFYHHQGDVNHIKAEAFLHNSDEDGHGEDGAGEKKTFDDILTDVSYQAEFYRRVRLAV